MLQLKQAEESSLESSLEPSPLGNHAERVVEGHRLIQASSDVLLGWLRTKGLDGVERDFYVRHRWDWKTSPELTRISAQRLAAHSRLCAWTLARAHSRTGSPVEMASYMGSGSARQRPRRVLCRSEPNRLRRVRCRARQRQRTRALLTTIPRPLSGAGWAAVKYFFLPEEANGE